MAFIGILLIDLILLALFIAAICGLIFLLGMGITALIGGIVLSATGGPINAKSKKTVFGIVLIVLSFVIFIPIGILVFRVVSMF